MVRLVDYKPPETRGQYVLDAVRRSLNDGSLAPGEHLTADDLSARLQVSHIPIREALRFLEAQGLLRRDARGRVFVPTLTTEEVDEIYGLREVLESAANRLAVPRMTDGDLAAMDEHHAIMVDALRQGDYPTYAAANRAFHFIPLRRAGGRWRLQFLELLWDAAARYQSAFMDRGIARSTVESQHSNLLEAYRARDIAKVERLMNDHRLLTVSATRKWMEARPGESADSTDTAIARRGVAKTRSARARHSAQRPAL